MEEEIYQPSAEELRLALIAFVLATCAVAFYRGQEFGPKRFAYISRQLGLEFKNQISLEDVQELMSDFEESSLSALGTLYEEMIYIATKYHRFAEAAGIEYVIPEGGNHFFEESGEFFDGDAIGDIGTVKGSIDKLMAKLPKWAQKILEAIMEALKLTKGG
jgi:hypothetical protein